MSITQRGTPFIPAVSTPLRDRSKTTNEISNTQHRSHTSQRKKGIDVAIQTEYPGVLKLTNGSQDVDRWAGWYDQNAREWRKQYGIDVKIDREV